MTPKERAEELANTLDQIFRQRHTHYEVVFLIERALLAQQAEHKAERDAAVAEALERVAKHLDDMYPTNGAPAMYVRQFAAAEANMTPKYVCEQCGFEDTKELRDGVNNHWRKGYVSGLRPTSREAICYGHTKLVTETSKQRAAETDKERP